MGVGHECCMSPEVLVTAGAGGIAWVFVKLLIIIPVPEDLPRLPTSEEIIEGRWGAPAVALPWNKQVSGFPKISGCQSGANNTFSLQPKHMLGLVSLRPPSLRFRKIIFSKVIVDKASDDMPMISLRSILGNHHISFVLCILLCCAAPMQNLSYTTCAQSKRPEKITLRLQNVCTKISQLDKKYFKDALLGQPLASLAQL